MKRVIEVADYEKQVQQEFHTPSLAYSTLKTSSPAKLNKDIGMGYRTLVALFFHNLPYIPLHFVEIIFIYT